MASPPNTVMFHPNSYSVTPTLTISVPNSLESTDKQSLRIDDYAASLTRLLVLPVSKVISGSENPKDPSKHNQSIFENEFISLVSSLQISLPSQLVAAEPDNASLLASLKGLRAHLRSFAPKPPTYKKEPADVVADALCIAWRTCLLEGMKIHCGFTPASPEELALARATGIQPLALDAFGELSTQRKVDLIQVQANLAFAIALALQGTTSIALTMGRLGPSLVMPEIRDSGLRTTPFPKTRLTSFTSLTAC